jgi:hypothetical protein
VGEYPGTQSRHAPVHEHQITVDQFHPLLHNTDMVKFLMIAVVCIFHTWFFYQFYKEWKLRKEFEKKAAQDLAAFETLLDEYIRRNKA